MLNVKKVNAHLANQGEFWQVKWFFWIALWKALHHWKQKHDPQPSFTSYLRGLLLPRQSRQFPAHQSIYQVTINEKLSLGKKPTATSTLLVTGKRAHVSLRRRKRATWLPQLPVDTDAEEPRSWWLYQKLQKLCRSKTCVLLVLGLAHNINRSVLFFTQWFLLVSSPL